MNNLNITGYEWFDKANGNSYFSADIQADGELVGKLPMQYGYGDHYIDMANQWLHVRGFIDNPTHEKGSREALWRYCEENNIDLYTQKVENCLKRDLYKG
mgnify:CR=1 FL=1